LQAALEFVLKLIRAMLGTMLLASVLLICANAFGRYVLLAPILWSEEVLGYSLVWMVYLGAVLVTASDQHLRMDLLLNMLPPSWQRVLRLIGDAVFVAVGLLIVYQAPESISQFMHHSQVAGLPMHIVHLAVPISFALTIVFVLLRAIAGVRFAADETQTPGSVA
jgi:TRAP-type C4-dicarboxylate transport system permease small subunit